MAREGITVKDIATRVARTGGDVARVAERIRHWTREGILVPLGERNGGTGNWRTYDSDAIYWAAVLNEMARYGLTVAITKAAILGLKDRMETSNDERALWIGAQSGQLTQPVYALVTEDGPLVLTANPDLVVMLVDTYSSGIWFNLGNLFKRLG